jgi:UPF0271 protein
MAVQVDINADLGESFGNWKLGNDEAFLPHVTSANIACGWHGGDPHVMRSSVALAVEHGVGIGAHVGFPDKLGFGRRHLQLKPEELKDYVLYQTGALQAFVTAEGGTMQHVKPHGACYWITAYSAEHGAAVAEAINELDSDLILISSGPGGQAARDLGVTVAWEGYIDLDYEPDGVLILERAVGAREPEQIAARALKLVTEKKIRAVDGSDFDLAVDTFCLHGDSPTAPEVARAVRHALVDAGVEVVPLGQHDLVHSAT